MSESAEWMSPSIRIAQLQVRADEAEQEAADLRAEVKRLRRLLDLLGAENWGIDNLSKLADLSAEVERLREMLNGKPAAPEPPLPPPQHGYAIDY